MTNYDEALSLIEGIEEGASSQQRKPFVIDSTSLSETFDIKQVDYNEVLKEFGIETARGRKHAACTGICAKARSCTKARAGKAASSA